jgi:hypothetical protein
LYWDMRFTSEDITSARGHQHFSWEAYGPSLGGDLADGRKSLFCQSTSVQLEPRAVWQYGGKVLYVTILPQVDEVSSLDDDESASGFGDE